MEKQLKVNGIDYLVFEGVCNTIRQADKLEKLVSRFNGILRKFDATNSFWNGITVRFEVLIPEKYAVQFSCDNV